MRNAYLLTTNPNQERTKFSKTLLEDIGFNVILFMAIKHKDKVISNKISMQAIYKKIINDNSSEWSYVFEDDINILKKINIKEIIEYEKISNKIIYLGVCRTKDWLKKKLINTEKKIAGELVYKTFGLTRGLHAIGLSRIGCKELLIFSQKEEYKDHRYMDVILCNFTENNPATIVGYNLIAYCPSGGWRGVFFQDQRKFPSTIKGKEFSK